jgi:hypothetical protein
MGPWLVMLVSSKLTFEAVYSPKEAFTKKYSSARECNLTHFTSFAYLNSPFGFAGSDKATLMNMREAELKHCRLAMLAVVGWPLAELFDKPIADAAGLPTALTKSGASPSFLNGGLENIDIAYWVAVAALAGIVELENMKVKDEKGKAYVAGDCGFDPIGFLPTDKAGQMEMMTKELKHGRIAMMAVLGFAAQEALFGTPVVAETPIFFQPLF